MKIKKIFNLDWNKETLGAARISSARVLKNFGAWKIAENFLIFVRHVAIVYS